MECFSETAVISYDSAKPPTRCELNSCYNCILVADAMNLSKDWTKICGFSQNDSCSHTTFEHRWTRAKTDLWTIVCIIYWVMTIFCKQARARKTFDIFHFLTDCVISAPVRDYIIIRSIDKSPGPVSIPGQYHIYETHDLVSLIWQYSPIRATEWGLSFVLAEVWGFKS